MGDNWKVFVVSPQFPQSEGTLASKGREEGSRVEEGREGKAGKEGGEREVLREFFFYLITFYLPACLTLLTYLPACLPALFPLPHSPSASPLGATSRKSRLDGGFRIAFQKYRTGNKAYLV